MLQAGHPGLSTGSGHVQQNATISPGELHVVGGIGPQVGVLARLPAKLVRAPDPDLRSKRCDMGSRAAAGVFMDGDRQRGFAIPGPLAMPWNLHVEPDTLQQVAPGVRARGEALRELRYVRPC